MNGWFEPEVTIDEFILVEYIFRMTLRKNCRKHSFDDQDLHHAVGLCVKHGSHINEGATTWRKLAWADVVGAFGEAKAELIFQRILELEEAFFSIKPRHSIGSSVVHDAKTVRKDFQAAFPATPPMLIESFESRYLWANR